MEYRNLGRTGLKVSELCLGTMTFRWTSSEEDSIKVLDRAWEAGINFIDTADVYSRWAEGNPGGVAETIIGAWLKSKPRDQIILATKARGRMWDGPNGEGLSRHHIMLAVEHSLQRLQTDVIDCIRPTTPIGVHRSKKRCAPLMISCIRARCAISAQAITKHGT